MMFFNLTLLFFSFFLDPFINVFIVFLFYPSNQVYDFCFLMTKTIIMIVIVIIIIIITVIVKIIFYYYNNNYDNNSNDNSNYDNDDDNRYHEDIKMSLM
jgi:heme/copper-type cytochrome/quinol oxidase subunit 2